MFTALITFLGGATVRLALGQFFDFVNKWQDQRNQLAMMNLQMQIDSAKTDQSLKLMQAQSELGIKEIAAQVEQHAAVADDDSFVEAVKNTGIIVGNVVIDAWNGVIRPLLATICIVLWVWSLWERKFALDDWDRSLISLALGIFVGGRIHATGR